VKTSPSIQVFSAVGPLAVACGLFLGTAAPARAESDSDRGYSQTAQENPDGDNGQAADRDDDSDRKLAGRRHAAASRRNFDPRVYEARGRELQGEYYEISTMAKAPSWSSRNTDATEGDNASGSLEPKSRSHTVWMWAAGIGTAAAAGAVGFYLFDHKAAPQTQNVDIALTDKP
jgi:hypothetical protein